MSTKEFSKERILYNAIELAKDLGIEKLSMRKIARKMGCSVTPIYDAFESRSDLEKEIYAFVVNENNKASSYLRRNEQVLAYGIAHPLLYRDIRKLSQEYENIDEQFKNTIDLMRKETLFKDFDEETLMSLHFDLMIYINGLVEKSILDFKKNSIMPKYQEILKQVTHLFVFGYEHAIKEGLK